MHTPQEQMHECKNGKLRAICSDEIEVGKARFE